MGTFDPAKKAYQKPAFVKNENKRAKRSGMYLFFFLVIIWFIGGTVGAATTTNSTIQPEAKIAYIGVYAVDFKQFSVADGTYQTNFYLTIRSGTNISINDLELMNGHVTSIDTVIDTPGEKNYRIFAVMTANPDLVRYPFDTHILPIVVEPKVLTEKDLVLAVDQNSTGLDEESNLPGWSLTGMSSLITNRTYEIGEIPYSRAIFSYGIERDTASTILKFFLPISLIVLVSLASLLMRVTSRLGLNGSMFLAAVLIHWRIADDIPLVAYATFLDYFMIITYATLVMVLISGILVLMYSEKKDTGRIEFVNRWSIRIIPALSIGLYALLFLVFFA